MTSWMLTPSPSLAVPVFYTDGLASNLTTLSYPLLAWTLSSLLPPSTHLSHRCPSCLHPAARQLLDLYLPSLIPPPHSLLLRRQQSSTVILKTSRQTHPFIKVALQCSLSCPGDKWISLMELVSKYLSPKGRDLERNPNTHLALIILNQGLPQFCFFNNASNGHTGLAAGGRVQPHMVTLESREETRIS